MESGNILARDVATAKVLRTSWQDGVITECSESDASPPANQWIAPTLFDVQINGYAGVDFQQDNLTAEDLLHAARALRRDGCAKFFLTLITDEWRALTARFRHAVALRETSPELKSAIVGWHIEGPFLSPEPGFHGAHDPALMLDPTPSHIRELREIAGDLPLLLTIAPERRGAIEAIEFATSRGVKISLGHTNASAEILADAIRAGATMFTHLANGCPRELDRHNNILWRVADAPGLTTSLIPDRIHVSPAPFRLLHRALGAERVFYTTDAMSAAGAPPGKYTIGKLHVEVADDQIVRQPGKTNFAGSALKPCDGVFRAAEMLNCPWQETWLRFSQTPARLIGIRHEIAVGARATFCIIRESDGAHEVQTYWNG